MIKAVIFDMYETLITHYHGGPLYFSTQIAEDIGAPVTRFQTMWRALEHDRTVGNISLEDTLEQILKKCNCYSEKAVQHVVEKRTKLAEECFDNLHEGILPMMIALKGKGLKIGLISNCFSDEAEVINRCVLHPYFAASCLSYEQRVGKPSEEIYQICMGKLRVKPEECLYIGDGGSQELEAARNVGMETAQACWYFREELGQNARRKRGFRQLNHPMDLLKLIDKELE